MTNFNKSSYMQLIYSFLTKFGNHEFYVLMALKITNEEKTPKVTMSCL